MVEMFRLTIRLAIYLASIYLFECTIKNGAVPKSLKVLPVNRRKECFVLNL
jgi:hypothetical protein